MSVSCDRPLLSWMPSREVTAVRRVRMRLEEREEGLQTEVLREGAVSRQGYQMPEKTEGSLFQIGKDAKPLCLMVLKNTYPPVEHGMCDPKTQAEFFYRTQVEKVFTDGPEDEEKAVGTIGDQEVCQDGMGMPTAPAFKSWDPNCLTGGPSVKEIHNISIIGGKTDTGSPAAAERADLLLRSEPLFQVPVEAGCRFFDEN